MGRELFVVARDRPDLYQYFRDTFAEVPTVQVIVDRRLGDRRRAAFPVTTERRQGERRSRTAEADLATTGYAFISLEASRSPIAR